MSSDGLCIFYPKTDVLRCSIELTATSNFVEFDWLLILYLFFIAITSNSSIMNHRAQEG